MILVTGHLLTTTPGPLRSVLCGCLSSFAESGIDNTAGIQECATRRLTEHIRVHGVDLEYGVPPTFGVKFSRIVRVVLAPAFPHALSQQPYQIKNTSGARVMIGPSFVF